MRLVSFVPLLSAFRKDTGPPIGTVIVTGVQANGITVTEALLVYRDGTETSHHDYRNARFTLRPR